MTHQERGFLDAIIAEPKDDDLRLIFADWLEENAGETPCDYCGGGRSGEWYYAVGRDGKCDACRGAGRTPDGRAARAAFIRVQVELAAMEARHYHECTSTIKRQMESATLRRRERELLVGPDGQCCRCTWHAPLEHYHGDGPKGAWEYRRGFVEAITCTAEVFRAHGDAIRRAQPLTRVKLTTWPTVWLESNIGYQDVIHEELRQRWPGVAFELPPPTVSSG